MAGRASLLTPSPHRALRRTIMGAMGTHGVTALIGLALAGGVGAGALGWVCAPWLRTLVPPPARGERWFLARPAVASCGVMAWVVALLAARGLGEFAALPAAAVVLGAATAASLVDAAGHRLPNVLVLRGWALAVIAVLVAMAG